MLDFVYVVVGCYDGYWEWGIKFWDIVVGEFIVCEVGGLVIDFKGGNDLFYKGEIVVGSVKVV